MSNVYELILLDHLTTVNPLNFAIPLISRFRDYFVKLCILKDAKLKVFKMNGYLPILRQFLSKFAKINGHKIKRNEKGL